MANRQRPTSSPTTPRAQTLVYYEPPPRPVPFYLWSAETIEAWLAQQDAAYQRTARTFAEEAGLPLVESERRRGADPCETCGYDGTPTKAHRWNCDLGVVKYPPPRSVTRAEIKAKFAEFPENVDEDDDLPF